MLVCLQDDPWVDLQCAETLHGDEPEALWWLHPTVQGRKKQVSHKWDKTAEFPVNYSSLWFYYVVINVWGHYTNLIGKWKKCRGTQSSKVNRTTRSRYSLKKKDLWRKYLFVIFSFWCIRFCWVSQRESQMERERRSVAEDWESRKIKPTGEQREFNLLIKSLWNECRCSFKLC